MNASNQGRRRVVITGLGLITPLGNSKEELWEALSGGRSGVQPLSYAIGEDCPGPFAGEARQFQGIDDFGPLDPAIKKGIRKGLKMMCRECQMGLAAAQRALHDAGLTENRPDPERAGVVFGCDYLLTEPFDFIEGVRSCVDDQQQFQFSHWATEGMPKMTPLWLLKYLPNMPASHIAIFNDLRGPNNSLTLREASGNSAIGEALRVIVRGHADVLVTGATGSRVHPHKLVHSVLETELAGNGLAPEEASRPFDLNRAGMVRGEGAGVIVLEELSHAQQRGATIYGEVIGAGSSSVSSRHSEHPRRTALANAMRSALREAGLEPKQIGHIHAHGLSTRSSDIEEAAAIGDVFGDRAAQVPLVAAKSYFGNLGAGSGIVELAASTLGLAHNRLFRVLNYQTPDPQCRVAPVVSDEVPPGDTFLNLSVTPQGQASCVVVRRYE